MVTAGRMITTSDGDPHCTTAGEGEQRLIITYTNDFITPVIGIKLVILINLATLHEGTLQLIDTKYS